MNLSRYILLLLIAASVISSAFAADELDQRNLHDIDLNERDLQALRDFLKSRREKPKEEKIPVRLYGDVRAEWRNIMERFRGRELRGGDSLDCIGLPISHNDFDIEANVRLDYDAKCTWAVLHFQYDNSAGISDNLCCCNVRKAHEGDKKEIKKCSLDRFHGSGSSGDLNLKRAYMGYTIWEEECASFDVELGRRKLYDVFESDIEFLSRFDGIVFQYSDECCDIADWYIKVAGWLVDERVNQFAWGTELALQNIYDSGFDIKYSYVDWTKRGRSRCGGHDPVGFDFRNSQLLLDYHLDPCVVGVPVEIYWAGLINHDAHDFCRCSCSHDNDQNKKHKDKKHDKHGHRNRHGLAWYGGIWVGRVREAGDWSVELEYQYVQDNAIAFDDQSGIGLGNIFEDCCDDDLRPTVGYKGVSLEFLYAITDNISLDTVIQYATSTRSRKHRYSEFKLEAIYVF